MERLTKRIDGIAVLESWAIDKDPVSIIQRLCNRLAAYEDSGLEPDEIEVQSVALAQCKPYMDALCNAQGKMVINPIHLRDLIQAEQDGRLVVLPCKVGATVLRAQQGRGF